MARAPFNPLTDLAVAFERIRVRGRRARQVTTPVAQRRRHADLERAVAAEIARADAERAARLEPAMVEDPFAGTIVRDPAKLPARPYEGCTRHGLRAARGRASHRRLVEIEVRMEHRDGQIYGRASAAGPVPARLDVAGCSAFGPTPDAVLRKVQKALRAAGHPFTITAVAPAPFSRDAGSHMPHTTTTTEDPMTKPTELRHLTPGTTFELDLHTMKGLFRLVRVNESRARIEPVTPNRHRTFTPAGAEHAVTIHSIHAYDVAPAMQVIPLTIAPASAPASRSRKHTTTTATAEQAPVATAKQEKTMTATTTAPAAEATTPKAAKATTPKAPKAAKAKATPAAAPVVDPAKAKALRERIAQKKAALAAAADAPKATAKPKATAAPKAPKAAKAPTPATSADAPNAGQQIVSLVDAFLASNPGASRRDAFRATAEQLGKSLLNVQSRYYTLTKGNGRTAAAPAAPKAAKAPKATAAPKVTTTDAAPVEIALQAAAEALVAAGKAIEAVRKALKK